MGHRVSRWMLAAGVGGLFLGSGCSGMDGGSAPDGGGLSASALGHLTLDGHPLMLHAIKATEIPGPFGAQGGSTLLDITAEAEDGWALALQTERALGTVACLPITLARMDLSRPDPIDGTQMVRYHAVTCSIRISQLDDPSYDALGWVTGSFTGELGLVSEEGPAQTISLDDGQVSGPIYMQ